MKLPDIDKNHPVAIAAERTLHKKLKTMRSRFIRKKLRDPTPTEENTMVEKALGDVMRNIPGPAFAQAFAERLRDANSSPDTDNPSLVE